MKAKKGVSLDKATFEIGYAVGVADSLFRCAGAELVVTSVNDSTHSTNSLHFKGRAVDLRSRHLSEPEIDALFEMLKVRLEPLGFDVVFEGDHFHIEYDPKKGESILRRVD